MPPRPSNHFMEFPADEIEQSIPARFDRVATRYADRRAVKDGTLELTYGELNRAANRIARAMPARSGQGDQPVALLLGHGASLVAAILGVLKAGRIYVPLDPSYPRARLAHILGDAGATLVITDGAHRALARSLSQEALPLLDLDRLDPSGSDAGLDLPIPPDAPAYVLYTSGSTGRPKGVVQSHRNVLWDV